MAPPDRLGDRLLQQGRDDQVWPKELDSLEHLLVIERQLDRHLVAPLAELDPGPLTHTVMSCGQE